MRRCIEHARLLASEAVAQLFTGALVVLHDADSADLDLSTTATHEVVDEEDVVFEAAPGEVEGEVHEYHEPDEDVASPLQ